MSYLNSSILVAQDMNVLVAFGQDTETQYKRKRRYGFIHEKKNNKKGSVHLTKRVQSGGK